MKQVFIDADALVALIRVKDKNHFQAKKIYQKLKKEKPSFISSNTSLYETLTVISQRIDKQKAKEFLSQIYQLISFIFVDKEIEKKASSIFVKQVSKNVSFFDCLNMAILCEAGIKEIFSFDKDYKKNGFFRIGVDKFL